MRVSINWLRDFIPVEMPPEELADRLENTGTAVESIIHMGTGIENIVVGHVLECKQHSASKKLKLCGVDVGGRVVEVVCGAPNVRRGEKGAVAQRGATL